MQLNVSGFAKTTLVLKAFVPRSLPIAVLACAQALSACSAVDDGEAGEQVANVAQEFVATGSGPTGGFDSVETAVVSRGAGLLDVFARGAGGNLYLHRYTSQNGWFLRVDLSRPSGVTIGGIAAAANGGRLDVFVAGQNGNVYHRFSNQTTGAPTWSNWFQVPDVIVKNPSSKSSITVTSWGSGRLDLFWVTPGGTLGHKWADNFVWSGTENGDSPSVWYLRPPVAAAYSPPLESVSTMPGRLDILFGYEGVFPGFKHHAYYGDAGGWQQPRFVACCDDRTGLVYFPMDFALAKWGAGPTGSFSVFVKQDDIGSSKLQWLSFQGFWWSPANRVRSVDFSQAFSQGVTLTDAVEWDGNRVSVAGTFNNSFGWLTQYP